MSEHPTFPTVLWGQTRATFLPLGAKRPDDAPMHAALVFAFHAGRFIVADIVGRGWCIPGGHLHPGETPEQAVCREAREETGATLDTPRLIGHFLLTELPAGTAQIVPTFIATVLRFDPLPAQTESRGVRQMSLEELPDNYFTWDALMEAIFPYTLAQWNALS